MLRFLLPSFCLALPLTAQNQTHLVDPVTDAVDAPAGARLAGLGGAGHQQILIGAGRLLPLKGKRLFGLMFRRDPGHVESMPGGQLDLQLRLATSSLQPVQISEDFANNLRSGAPQQVFRGRVSLPTAPKWTAASKHWAVDQVLRIDFQQGFLYQGGSLLVDLQATPVTGAEPRGWYVDFAMSGSGGQVQVLGASCAAAATGSGQSLFADSYGLQIGSSFRATQLGRPGALPLMLFGVQPLATGIDLGFMGAPGCEKLVQELSIVPMAYQVRSGQVSLAALNFTFQVPAQTSLLGAAFCLQFAEDERPLGSAKFSNSAGLTTGNGLRLQLAAAAPSLDLANLSSVPVAAGQALPKRGVARPEMAPVMRLIYR